MSCFHSGEDENLLWGTKIVKLKLFLYNIFPNFEKKYLLTVERMRMTNPPNMGMLKPMLKRDNKAMRSRKILPFFDNMEL